MTSHLEIKSRLVIDTNKRDENDIKGIYLNFRKDFKNSKKRRGHNSIKKDSQRKFYLRKMEASHLQKRSINYYLQIYHCLTLNAGLGAESCLSAMYGQRHTTLPELRSCDRGCGACKAASLYCLTFNKNMLLTQTCKIKF